jgi:hypothetical protein
MFEDALTRREAMAKILKTIAAAVGLSVTDLTLLISNADAATLTNLKMLKVKLSGFNRQVFESEFGRITPLAPLSQVKRPLTQAQISRLQRMVSNSCPQDGCTMYKPILQTTPSQTMSPTQTLQPGQIQPGQPMVPVQGMAHGNLTGCMVQYGALVGEGSFCPNLGDCGGFGSGTCPILDHCTEHVCTRDSMGCLDLWGPGGPSPGGGCHTNDCNDQNCGELTSCGDNECSGQKCPSLNDCGHNCTHSSGLVDLLNQFRIDPYIQDLMRFLNVTTTQQLAMQVQNMLNQRRYITPQQIRQGATTAPR